jgi:hypothetical protein
MHIREIGCEDTERDRLTRDVDRGGGALVNTTLGFHNDLSACDKGLFPIQSLVKTKGTSSTWCKRWLSHAENSCKVNKQLWTAGQPPARGLGVVLAVLH